MLKYSYFLLENILRNNYMLFKDTSKGLDIIRGNTHTYRLFNVVIKRWNFKANIIFFYVRSNMDQILTWYRILILKRYIYIVHWFWWRLFSIICLILLKYSYFPLYNISINNPIRFKDASKGLNIVRGEKTHTVCADLD